jgi:hypothetical protein
MSRLNIEQTKVVKTYFEALAFFRDEECPEASHALLSNCTATYAMIMVDGGGDPVLLAARFIFGEDATSLTLI